MVDCKYPNCEVCDREDCDMDENDIIALLKRRRWNKDPETYRKKQRDYRRRVLEYLPHCNECQFCILVKKDKGDGFRRLCAMELRLIEQKVTNSPQWCNKRKKPRKEINNASDDNV